MKHKSDYVHPQLKTLQWLPNPPTINLKLLIRACWTPDDLALTTCLTASPFLALAPLLICSGHRHYCFSLICQTSIPQGLCTCHLPGTLLTQTFSWTIFSWPFNLYSNSTYSERNFLVIRAKMSTITTILPPPQHPLLSLLLNLAHHHLLFY